MNGNFSKSDLSVFFFLTDAPTHDGHGHSHSDVISLLCSLEYSVSVCYLIVTISHPNSVFPNCTFNSFTLCMIAMQNYPLFVPSS